MQICWTSHLIKNENALDSIIKGKKKEKSFQKKKEKTLSPPRTHTFSVPNPHPWRPCPAGATPYHAAAAPFPSPSSSFASPCHCSVRPAASPCSAREPFPKRQAVIGVYAIPAAARTIYIIDLGSLIHRTSMSIIYLHRLQGAYICIIFVIGDVIFGSFAI